jgi:hypothetical protein
MIPNEIVYKADDTAESYRTRLMQFFHRDGNDKPSREAAVACGNACRLVYKLEEARASKQEPVEDLAFPVIQRTVTVDLPSHGGQ